MSQEIQKRLNGTDQRDFVRIGLLAAKIFEVGMVDHDKVEIALIAAKKTALN